ncbi:hypothetical protein KSS87_006321 [Heliosperma pusillum]|nr:hypothetical protein KSS87_006321 [Heliosperma pusillum]
MLSGLLLALSFLKYVYHPFQWLAVAAVVVGVRPILTRGVVALRNFTLDVNILMIIAVICTIIMRDYTEAGTIVFLFTIAEWLESRASHKATAVMSSLLSMAPQKATIAETGEVVNVEDVKLSTVVAVKSGDMIPVDGLVVDGTCEVDEKTLTGESYPVPKQKDSTVWAGTVNVNGYISVKTTALAEDSAVAKMARLVEEAQNSRSSVQRLIDKCAKYYTPAVVLISLGVAVVPVILKAHNLRHWFYLALVVLVSACPCGLILSTPVATFCALSRAATSGLLIKGGDHLETLAKIKTIGFDKTGTITRGEFTLMNFQTLADDVRLNTLLYWVSSIESKSSHPTASVMVDYGRSQSIEPKPEKVVEFQNFPGEGVCGVIDGKNLYIGNKKLAQRAKCNIALNGGGDTKDGATSGYVFCEGVLIGTFSLSDNCRSGALDAVKELKAMGIRTALLTGDNQSAAMHAQEQLGYSLDFVHSELLPEDKASIIKDYKTHGPTAMVGDGVNDAPALATADVGISMGVSGSALATETGHVILMSNDIRKIPKAIKLARKTRRKVIENIFISIVTKACVIASAIAWHPLVWLAVLADVMTCLIVIFNSMLLLRGGHEGHKHGRKWSGLFSCHSHKNKCHSTGHQHSEVKQQCCSKTVSPCDTRAKCRTDKTQKCCSVKTAPEPLNKLSESSRCLLHDCSTSCKTSDECVPQHPLSESPKDGHEYHQASCCNEDHCPEALESQVSCHGGEHHKHETLPKCHHEPKKDGHEHHQVTCYHENHCLEALESQVSCHGGEHHKHETLPKCHHEPKKNGREHHQAPWCHENHCPEVLESQVSCHGGEHHKHESVPKCHHEPKKDGHEYHQESCCHENHCPESLESLVRCDAGKHDKHETLPKCHHESTDDKITGQLNTVVLHHEANHVSACSDQCASSLEIHAANSHLVEHMTCHKNVVSGHSCTGLRKREVGSCCQSFRKACCSSNANFVPGFAGLTEIVTE